MSLPKFDVHIFTLGFPQNLSYQIRKPSDFFIKNRFNVNFIAFFYLNCFLQILKNFSY